MLIGKRNFENRSHCLIHHPVIFAWETPQAPAIMPRTAADLATALQLVREACASACGHLLRRYIYVSAGIFGLELYLVSLEQQILQEPLPVSGSPVLDYIKNQ